MNLLRELKTQYHLRKAALMGHLRRRLCGPHARAIIAETPQGRFACDPEDMGVGWKLCEHGSYDAERIEELLRLVTPESRVLVAGTHIGTLVVPLARAVREVIAFEANPATFGLFTTNLLLNGISNCKAHNLALGAQAGTARFLQNRVNSGGSKIMPKTMHSGYVFDHPAEVEVQVVALDEVIDDPRFDLIIMDIEGSEYAALSGMPRALAASSHLQVEYLPHHLDNVAGVTDQAFAALLEPHFGTMTLQGSNRQARCGAFAAFLTRLRADGVEGDLFLAK